jgi:hypothetical protein
MAAISLFGSTARGTTSVTLFGTLGPWTELPDEAPPILWIDTTSPAGQNQGLYAWGHSTSPSLPETVVHVQVANYEPGTKWFLPTDIGLFTAGGAIGFSGEVIRKYALYYRSVGEGPDPNRMQ